MLTTWRDLREEPRSQRGKICMRREEAWLSGRHVRPSYAISVCKEIWHYIGDAK
jgi:hypothetical protein